MRVALIYDWLNRWGGAERVLQSILEIWPQARVFSAVYDRSRAKFLRCKPKTTFIQKLPGAKKHAYWYYPWLSLAFETLDLNSFDVAISLSSGPAKAIVTSPKTLHIHYCLTPPRYFWQKQLNPWPRIFFSLASLRRDDYYLGQRPDIIFAISKAVAARVWKYYRRQSEVIYPGINLKNFSLAQLPAGRRAPFLLVSRLVGYKRVDLAIKAFNQLEWPLWVVGKGRDQKKLRQLAGRTIRFLGTVGEQELSQLYRQSRGLIMPQEEDFGLVSLEAQAAGRPVIAYQRGGAMETIVAGETGLFFKEQTVAALVAVLRQFVGMSFSPQKCRRQAEKFSDGKFKRRFETLVNSQLKSWRI